MRLWTGLVSLVGMLLLAGTPARAQEIMQQTEPATTVTEWVAQIEASLVQITDVRIEETDAGLQVVLETAEGTLAEPTTSVSGNALILEISNAVLLGEGFEEFAPAAGIALVQVSPLSGDRVQVAITGAEAAPQVTVGSNAAGLALNVVPGVAQASEEGETIQLVVTGEEDEGYNPSRSSTATGTDTPLRDIPFSIQVIPEEVLEDRNVTELGDALETAGGVVSEGTRGTGLFGPGFIIRGFPVFEGIFRDGVPAITTGPLSTNDVERVEVLRGPASILFGQGEPGGIINLVTKKPISEPFYEVSASAGSFDSYSGAVDLSGPFTETSDVRYRLNLSYENYGSFRDFVDGERFQVSPRLAWDIGPNTSLDVYSQYTYDRETVDEGIPFFSDGTPAVPNDRFLGEDFGEFTQDQFNIGYRLNHNFSDNWSISHNAQYLEYQPLRYYPFVDSFDEVTGEAERVEYAADDAFRRIFTNAEVRGQFNTGPAQHQLLFGIEYRHEDAEQAFQFSEPFASINAFDPIYTDETYEIDSEFFRDDTVDTIRVYLQDQIDITPELILLVGVGFEYADQFRTEQNEGEPRQEFEQTDEAFTPRVGVVYQPIDPLSLYASYTTSFNPSFGTERNPDDSAFEPEEGRQFEVGLKADLSNRLSLNLAAFDIRRQNVTTPDPDDPLFSVQTGEVASRGIELGVNGEILPGWNVTAAYTYLDAFVSEDNTDIEGNRLVNVPDNQFSLWTTYEIQTGDLEGLGLGLGFFYVDERAGDSANTFELPDYFRTDAALFYKRDNWRAQLNFENVFDIEYFTSTNYGSSLYVNPGAPFGVSASFSIEL
ncbi:MAG: TonB-dependent siderophore receptor [Cyanobacteria bacterium J06626_6]